MSVKVEGISKRFGAQLAVNDVSFTVGSGEIVGFIGPNGAGKSTTMKIITGTVRPDSGSVMIKDMPVLDNLKAARSIIGYLPEHNPLYLEMYIREYLDYVAELYGVKGKTAGQRVQEVIEMTGLGPEIGKTIGKLSKGFRQRVGLAQALIHDPEILILDEPTTGLDPNQLEDIRRLISTIGKEKTILLSTHIMQEVEAICDRVLIIRQGQIVADDASSMLREQGSGRKHTIKIELSETPSPEIWSGLKQINEVKTLNSNTFLLECSSGEDIRADIFKYAVGQGLTILSLNTLERSLEEVFREYTRA